MDSESFLEDVRKYAKEHADKVKWVASAFEAAGGEASDLDGLVHDVAGSYGADAANDVDDKDAQEAAITAFEGEASYVNNEGIRSQVAAIMMGNGAEEGERLVMEAAGAVLARTIGA